MTAVIAVLLAGQAAARFATARARLLSAARASYPHSGSPIGALMLERMGIEPKNVVFGSLTKRGYLTFAYTPSGKRIIRDRETMRVKHYWTREQKAILRDYWPLIERGAKGRR